MRRAGKQGELSGPPSGRARPASAQKAEHLHGMLGPDDVGIADDQQGRGGQRREAGLGPGRRPGAVELVQLDDERCPGTGIGRDPAVRLVPP